MLTTRVFFFMFSDGERERRKNKVAHLVLDNRILHNNPEGENKISVYRNHLSAWLKIAPQRDNNNNRQQAHLFSTWLFFRPLSCVSQSAGQANTGSCPLARQSVLWGRFHTWSVTHPLTYSEPLNQTIISLTALSLCTVSHFVSALTQPKRFQVGLSFFLRVLRIENARVKKLRESLFRRRAIWRRLWPSLKRFTKRILYTHFVIYLESERERERDTWSSGQSSASWYTGVKPGQDRISGWLWVVHEKKEKI